MDTETSIAASYSHSGIAITASTGDSGYGTASPFCALHLHHFLEYTLDSASVLLYTVRNEECFADREVEG